jgi:DNA-binding MurR/RpiR family transcriptional regulator
MDNLNILRRIKDKQGAFSNQQAKIAAYLMEHHKEAAFMTATQLAQKIGVSQPTVIRFSQFLGFSHYSFFLEALQSVLKAELTSYERLQLSIGQNNADQGPLFDIVTREMQTLEKFLNYFPQQSYEKLVKEICGSRKLAIVGTRGSASLAQYFSYFLGKVKRNVTAITCGATKSYDYFLDSTPDDLAVGIAFPRYPRETIEIMEFCREQNLAVAGITDKIDSPLANVVDTAVVIPITFTTIFDSYCSALCLFNIIVTAVGRINRKESEVLSGQFERLAQSRKVFM